MSSVRNLTAPADKWIAGAIPLTAMMNMEHRHGEDKPVIKKALVELDGAPFKMLAANRDKWAVETSYVYPGPIQFFGPSEVADITTITEATEFLERLEKGGPFPMFTSCCPAWVKFCEDRYPDLFDNIATCRSPQGMYGGTF